MKLMPSRPDRGELAELSALRGTKAEALAFGRGDGVLVVGLRDALAARSSTGWLIHGYHELARGGWDPKASVLWWETLAGERTRVTLTAPGRLPELFRERMTASVIVDHVVSSGQYSIRVVARRDPADPLSALTWTASPLAGTPSTEAMNQLLIEAMEWVKDDYIIA